MHAFLSLLFSMHALFSLLFSLSLSLVEADVVAQFQDVPECLEYFYQGKVPEWGATTPGAARLCQRFANRYHFATLYDTAQRIAVYSAYRFQPSNGGGREKRWFVEPQVGHWDGSQNLRQQKGGCGVVL